MDQFLADTMCNKCNTAQFSVLMSQESFYGHGNVNKNSADGCKVRDAGPGEKRVGLSGSRNHVTLMGLAGKCKVPNKSDLWTGKSK